MTIVMVVWDGPSRTESLLMIDVYENVNHRVLFANAYLPVDYHKGEAIALWAKQDISHLP